MIYSLSSPAVSSSSQDGFSEAEAVDLTERCELISERLMSLEDELHTAMLNQDQALTHILSRTAAVSMYVRACVCVCVSVCLPPSVHPKNPVSCRLLKNTKKKKDSSEVAEG